MAVDFAPVDDQAARRVVGVAARPAVALDSGATLDDLREAVTTLEDTERIARLVFGGEHPTTTGIEDALQDARVALWRRRLGHARETPPPPAAG